MAVNEQSTPVYLVLGASGGIGANLSRTLASRGGQLVLAARDSDRLRNLAAELSATAYPLDATRISDVDSCLAQVVEKHGRVDGVVNCVGSLLLKPAHATTEDEWLTALNLNLTSAFATVRAAAKVMPQGGSVVLMSSVAARVGLANHEAIAAAKAGVIGLTLSAAATYASRRLRVNCVAPGLVRTPLTERLTSSEVALRASTAMHPLGRIGEPDDIAQVIAWLLGPDSSWITGQVISVDGGMSTVRTR